MYGHPVHLASGSGVCSIQTRSTIEMNKREKVLKYLLSAMKAIRLASIEAGDMFEASDDMVGICININDAVSSLEAAIKEAEK